MTDRFASGAFAPTAVFVLLWSSGGIAAEIGLAHASPFALLLLRYAITLSALTGIGLVNGQLLPERGTRGRVALTGLLMTGLYTIGYFLALDQGIAPGVLAAILGIQPILTAALTERRFSPVRLLGLGIALGGLTLLVWDGISVGRFTLLGFGWAILSLLGMTLGAIAQKREPQAPSAVLPLQYAIGFALCCVIVPFEPFELHWTVGFVIPLLWLSLGISVGAVFLLYRLIARGNLVNVTSLFYLVPGVTALMDWLILGNALALPALVGLAGIVAGLVLVFRY